MYVGEIPRIIDGFVQLNILLFGFNRIYGINFKLKLDEREQIIVNKTSGAAAFILIFLMLVYFSLRTAVSISNGITINEYWGYFLVPVFLIAHSSAGLILSSFE